MEYPFGAAGEDGFGRTLNSWGYITMGKARLPVEALIPTEMRGNIPSSQTEGDPVYLRLSQPVTVLTESSGSQ
ncbi:hypothetical protein EMPG_16119 [Blastomyces silverae]|uniref:Uncharacterized protein n=1 Tax=Blastomyces silverae TaxID=2060906 RepID=A0A0H1BBF6_9EURO|nr:hypothetical protein EMPG_16119 [Blastomyces silverae]